MPTTHPEAQSDLPVDDTNEIEQEKTEPNVGVMISILEKQLSDTRKQIAEIIGGLKIVKKQAGILTKTVEKRRGKKHKKDTQVEGQGVQKASGFAAPSVLSAELKKFMGIGPLEHRSRTEVTKWLCHYVSENQLQGEGDKRYIAFERNDAGKSLKKLLQVEDRESITYFDLQHYLKYHISSKANPISFEDSVFDDGTISADEMNQLIAEHGSSTKTDVKTEDDKKKKKKRVVDDNVSLDTTSDIQIEDTKRKSATRPSGSAPRPTVAT